MQIVGVGDAIISRRLSFLTDEGFTKLTREIRAGDCAYVNFEMVIPRLPAIPEAAAKAIRLASPAWTLDELSWMGFDLFGLANNHAYDFTFVGLADTIDVFEDRGLAFSGAGRSLEAARMPCYLDTPKGRIALINIGTTAAVTSLAADGGILTAPRAGINPLRFETEYRLEAAHFDALARVDEALGTAATTRSLMNTGVFPGPVTGDPAVERLFLGRRFHRDTVSHVATRPSQRDIDQIAMWISEARRSADIVVIGIHAHESTADGINLDPPADFISEAAHAFIDTGADAIFGHGPHRLRGVEIYRDKPIFYSLGNFMFMDETLTVFDPFQYDVFGIGPNPTPADLHDFRERGEDGELKGFHSDSAFWEGALATCEFDGRSLTSVSLTPLALDHASPRSGRGIPRIAGGEHGRSIIERIAQLSQPYGTQFETDLTGDVPKGRVVLV